MIGLNNLLAAYDDKSAYALCTIAYHSGDDNSDVVLFEGKTMVRQFLLVYHSIDG